MSSKVPGVFYPRIQFGCSGSSENEIGVGSFGITGYLPNGRMMDIASIDYQNTNIARYNAIDSDYKAEGRMDDLMKRSSIDRRLSRRQADWLTREIVKRLNEISLEGIPHDDDLPS